ncbi:MAG: carboxypeptidase-like regulatory domain-containing protein [Bacteroidia bacterium]
MFRFFTIIILLSLSPLFAQTGSLSGKVTDAKTGETLVGTTILIQETQLGAITGDDGFFTINDIPPKTYNVEARFLGYVTSVKFNVVIRTEGNIDLNFEMEESNVSIDEVVIRPNPFEKLRETPLSIQKLSAEEVASYPGGNNDIAKVVQSLPGVSGSPGGFRNDVIIRGGAPNENVYYLDGIEIPNINHFATQGSAGGPVGLLNVSFFEGVELTTSSFGSQYDNTLSGVLQFNQRTGNAKDLKGNFRLGASEAAVTLEGPLFKGDRERARTTFIGSVRRSYLQVLFDLIGLPFLPDYWDYQYKLNHQIDDYNDLLITGVGSIDDFKINELEEFDEEQQAQQDQVPVIQQRTNSMGMMWKRRFKDGSGSMQTTLSTNRLFNNFSNYTDNVNQTGLIFQNDAVEQETKLRYKLTKFMGEWTTSGGFSTQYANYSNETQDLVNNATYSADLNFVRYGLFLQTNRRFAKDRMGISIGLRADGNTFTTTGNEIYRTLSPRMALSYRLKKDGAWTLNTSIGRYYKIPPYTILGFQNNAGVAINQDSRYIRSDHFVLGTEYLVGKSGRFTIEGFLKLYNDYPVSIRDSVSVANKGGGFEVLGNEPVASVGKGRTYGMEILYQQKFSGRFYAIASYTFYVSEFTGFDQSNFLPSVWDNRHIVSLLGGIKLGGNWEISSRYRYLGKTPFAPIDQAASLQSYPALVRDFSRLGEEQLSAFSQLDIRVDKKFNFNTFSLDLYFDIQNAAFGSVADEPRFGLRRTDDGAVVQPRELVQLPMGPNSGTLLPSLGIVLNF